MPDDEVPREPGRSRLGLWAACATVVVLLSAAACTKDNLAHASAPRVTRAVHLQTARSPQDIKDVAGKPIPFGSARYFGGLRASEIGAGVVGIAPGPLGKGYWLGAGNGTVFCYGTAKRYSFQVPAKTQIVAIVSSANADGYWLASSTGQVFGFGGAVAEGSASPLALSSPIVAMAATPDGAGYWLAAAGGRVLTHGDAQPYGSATSELYHDQVVAIAASADGRGYWLAASDGQVFAFGDAHPYGSAAGEIGNGHLVAMAVTPDRHGYWLASADGRMFGFGDAHLYGTASAVVHKNPIVAMASARNGRGYWLLPTNPLPAASLPAPSSGFVPGHVTSIGDSVMIDAQPALQAAIPGIDVEAAVSRQWYAGVALAQQLKSEGRLGAIVVIDLGTNGPVTPQMFTQMMDVLAGASRVVFVTVHLPPGYSWRDSVNATLEQGVRSYPRARIADFNKLADEHPEWFYGDGVHMPIGGAGAQAMAQLIKTQI